MAEEPPRDLFEGAAAGGDGPPPVSLGAPGRWLAHGAAAMILFMMLVTSIDVAGRYFLNRPLPGAFEFTEIMMGLVIFAGMPLASARREHITVNLLEKALGYRARCLQAAFGDLVCGVVAAFMAWRVLLRGNTLVASGEVTLVLGVGRGYIAWGMAALLTASIAVFLYSGWTALKAARAGGPPR